MKRVLKSDLVRKHFNHAAPSYEEYSFVQRVCGERLIDRLQYMLITPKRILDLGCGTGYFRKQLARRYPNAHLIEFDLAYSMLKEIQRHTEDISQSLVCGDMLQLPFGAQSMDLIFANLSIHWSGNDEMLFKECQRVLSPGGLLLFSTLGSESFYELKDSWANVDNDHHTHDFMDMHYWGDLLVKTHYHEPVVDREHLEVTYPSVMPMLRDLKGVGCQNVHPLRRRTLTGKNRLQAMMTSYERFKNADNVFPLHYELIYGQAWGSDQLAKSSLDVAFEARIPANSIPIRRK